MSQSWWKSFKWLHISKKLKQANFPSQVLSNFYRRAIESILDGKITNWHGIGKMCLQRAQKISKDKTHASHSLSSLLPSGRKYRSIGCRTNRLQSSFFLRLWDSWTLHPNSTTQTFFWQFFFYVVWVLIGRYAIWDYKYILVFLSWNTCIPFLLLLCIITIASITLFDWIGIDMLNSIQCQKS